MSTQTLAAAHRYLRRGWAPISIPLGQKAPILKDRPHARFDAEELSGHFARAQNIGILLGDPSGGLTDIDLDTPEAVVLAPRILPASGAIFGRRQLPAFLAKSKRPFLNCSICGARAFFNGRQSIRLLQKRMKLTTELQDR
jgi:Bifunctional DNA primase/polymerase, N-terminal